MKVQSTYCKNFASIKSVAALLCAAALALSGCSVMQMAKGEPGADIDSVRPGMTRDKVEAILGPSIRDMQVSSGVRYRVYRYNAGIETEREWLYANAYMEVGSFGLWELYRLVFPDRHDHERQLEGQVAISYDSNDVILGVFRDFGDFDTLPPDGIARASTAEKSP